MTDTLLKAIQTRLEEALSYSENVEVAPVALLWPDQDRQFGAAIEALRGRYPVLTLGELNAPSLTGPSYWLRCVLAQTIELEIPAGTPVVYLPGVARQDLRAIEGCPRNLAPIAELQYRGQWFAHPNGRDWTIPGLLSNRDRGLGLDVAEDASTLKALRTAFAELIDLPIERLEGSRIDSGFLNKLLNPDQIGSLLEWLDNPQSFRSRVSDDRWDAFVDLSKKDYELDPAKEGELIGARKLVEAQGAWKAVWHRFEQEAERYPGIETRLRAAKPTDQLFAGPEGAWPQDNEEAEGQLRVALLALDGASSAEVREKLSELWAKHGKRRSWVWARLDRSPMVFALEQLQRLAKWTTSGGKKADVDDLATAYATLGWQADDAYVQALHMAAEQEDREAVIAAANSLYRPWLGAEARAFQEALKAAGGEGAYQVGPEASTEPGVVTVFVDGLRLDLAHRLKNRLSNAQVEIDASLAALPTVTPTAKPVLTPIDHDAVTGGDQLAPVRADSHAVVNAAVLRSLMAKRDIKVLKETEVGEPSGCAWTEIGDIDNRGHNFQAGLVEEVPVELDRIARRVMRLLEAGWQQVDVVTDHGWLLVPGGLEKVGLPAATVQLKKGRCARLKPGASVSVPTVPWYWDRDVEIALAPGATCFEANQEYEHGGVSPQECVVPRIHVRPAARHATAGGVMITRIKWLRLICRLEFEGVPHGAKVDIRGLPSDERTSIAKEVSETTGAGKASLIVEDEELEGEGAFVVIVGPDGEILAQREVTVGMNV